MKYRQFLSLLLIAALLAAAVPFGLAETILKRGDSGEEVRAVQERLKELHYLSQDPTGTFDETTEQAVLEFQERNDLLATGMVDSKTREVLFSEEAEPALTKAVEEGQSLTVKDMIERLLTGVSGAPSEMDMEVEDGYGSAAPMALESVSAASASMPAVSAANAMYARSAGERQWNTNEYTYFHENGFQSVSVNPLSTFAADVDTASYAQVRSMILAGQEVPPDAVRVEEMLNYFHYDYEGPKGDSPFGVSMALAPCPWNEETLLLQVGLQAKEVMAEERPPHNLVFLIDVSGSMFGEDRLDLVKRAFLLLLDVLSPEDRVSLVTYASRDEVVLAGVPAADKVRISSAIQALEAGGSTNSAAGIRTAYQLAERYAVPGGVNRIIMATDGDFNVGLTSEGDLARLVMEKKLGGTRLTMLGVGYGNYKDNKLEALADYGDGNYYYLDTVFEARRALATEAGGTFVEVARDVKLQLDFNPARVSAYRLIGYEDRVMDARDFADDTKDGGEIGSGHRVTALYEIVPAGSSFQADAPVSKYQATAEPTGDAENAEWLTLNIRYKKPEGGASTLETWPLSGEAMKELPENMRFAASVAEAAMILRDSEYKGTSTFDSALSLARSCPSVTGDAFKEEFVYLLTLLQRR